MTSEKFYDELLYPILSSGESITDFFDKIFDFLYRRTDYFKIKSDSSSKMGLEMGEAERIVRSVFCKYMEQGVVQHKLEMQNKVEPVSLDYIAEEVITTAETNQCEDVEMPTESVLGDMPNASSTDEPEKQSEPKIPWMDPDCYNGARFDDYAWAQSLKDVDIRVKMDDSKRTSKAWQYFTDLYDGRAKCNHCAKILSYKGGGPFNLIRHTKSKHPFVFQAITENVNKQIDISENNNVNEKSTSIIQTEQSVSSASSSNTEVHVIQPENKTLSSTKMIQYFAKPLSAEKTELLNKLVLKLITKNYLPFHLVESQELKDLLKELNPSYSLPTRKTLSNALLLNHYNVTKEKIQEELNKVKYVSLTTDGWTSKPNENYLGITVHFMCQVTGTLQSYMIDLIPFTDRHNAKNLHDELIKVASRWNLESKIVSVTTDNAFNVREAVREEKKWKHVQCFAHTLNLIAQAALAEITVVQTKVKNIVGLFKRSPLASERLRSMQEKLGEEQLKVIQDCPTHWNSTYDMFERFLKIKHSITSTLAIHYNDMEGLSSEDVAILENTVEILSLFKDVTEQMSSEKHVTISEVILMANALRDKCREFAEKSTLPETVKKMTKVLSTEINSRFYQIEENNTFAHSTLLDPRFKKHGFANPNACDRACISLRDLAGRVSLPDTVENTENNTSTSAMPPPSKKSRSIWDAFDKKMSEVLKNTNPTAGGIVEFERYMEEPILPRHMDPIKWWFRKKDAYPRLYEIVLQKLCVPATSVPPERLFSKAGQILCERRNRLSGKKVSQILFLKNNL